MIEMSSIEEAIAEMNDIALAFDTSGPYIAREVNRIVRASAHQVEVYAKQAVPVDTGATRSSIGVDIGGHDGGPGYAQSAEIGPTTSYAPYLEFGTERMAPHAFMGPALDRVSPGFVAALDAVVDPLEGRP